MHGRWVQTAVNALNSPSVGWVMTIFSLREDHPAADRHLRGGRQLGAGVRRRRRLVVTAVVGAAAREGDGGPEGTQALEDDPARRSVGLLGHAHSCVGVDGSGEVDRAALDDELLLGERRRGGSAHRLSRPRWSNMLPWHGQLIVSVTSSTVQPWWVQTAVNPLKSPLVGWVITSFCSARITPPPTGTSAVAAMPPSPFGFFGLLSWSATRWAGRRWATPGSPRADRPVGEPLSLAASGSSSPQAASTGKRQSERRARQGATTTDPRADPSVLHHLCRG